MVLIVKHSLGFIRHKCAFIYTYELTCIHTYLHLCVSLSLAFSGKKVRANEGVACSLTCSTKYARRRRTIDGNHLPDTLVQIASHYYLPAEAVACSLQLFLRFASHIYTQKMPLLFLLAAFYASNE